MPEEGVAHCGHSDVLTFEEYLEVIRAFCGLGLRKVRLTGGEPLVKRGVVDLVRRIKEEGVREIAMTTNGTLLAEKAKALKAAGLDRVNISLDTFDPVRYAAITRGGRIEQVLAGIEAALAADLVPVKLNCVLLPDTEAHDVAEMVERAAQMGVELRFIELMPIGEAIPMAQGSVAKLDVRRLLGWTPVASDDPAAPARMYRTPWGSKVGWITPMSCAFCDRCNRLRLDCHGRLYACLHGRPTLDLRAILRSGGDVRAALECAILEKPDAHHLLDGVCQSNRMHTIGG